MEIRRKDEFLELEKLAQNVLAKIRELVEKESKGKRNPLGFLGYVLLFESFIHAQALQEADSMTRQLVSEIVEKLEKEKREVKYIA